MQTTKTSFGTSENMREDVRIAILIIKNKLEKQKQKKQEYVTDKSEYKEEIKEVNKQIRQLGACNDILYTVLYLYTPWKLREEKRLLVHKKWNTYRDISHKIAQSSLEKTIEVIEEFQEMFPIFKEVFLQPNAYLQKKSKQDYDRIKKTILQIKTVWFHEKYYV